MDLPAKPTENGVEKQKRWAAKDKMGISRLAREERTKPCERQPCAREFLSSSAEGPKGP